MKPIASRSRKHAPIALESFLPYRFSILSNRVSAAIARQYQQRFDLSNTEWRVIAVLGRFETLSAREVAQRTAMDKVAVSRALARLVAAGRVRRRTHHGDKRRSVLGLSTRGWAIHDAVAPLALAHERALRACLSAGEQAALERILDKLTPV
ncbi:MAG: MarR family transcriptional regulator [Proteobacteria bacterium]|nr:MarR family transcriptional regulator [Pseudomonadota bacterium]